MTPPIRVYGDEYPTGLTIGAIIRFKEETGKEMTEIKGLSEYCIFIWCCVASACERQGKEFSLSLMKFADGVDIAELMRWKKAFDAEYKGVAEEDGEKKSPRQQRS